MKRTNDSQDADRNIELNAYKKNRPNKTRKQYISISIDIENVPMSFFFFLPFFRLLLHITKNAPLNVRRLM